MAQTTPVIEPLDEDEALTLAITKLWLMEDERRREEDLGRQYLKGLVCENHLALVRQTPDVADSGPASPGAWHDLLLDPEKVADRWSGFASRERAMLFLLELVAFSPWGPESSAKHLSDRATQSRRLDRLRRVASNAGSLLGADDANELDRGVTKAIRKCAHDPLKTAMIAVGVIGGATAGALAGGLAAPALGGMIGSSMGYSGVVATNAGLALLGGGSLASGGAGMAGGTALIVGVAGAAGLGGGAVGGNAAGSNYLSMVDDNQLLVDVAKLTVVARNVLGGPSKPDRLALLRAGLERRRDELTEEVDALGGKGGLLRRPQTTRKLITVENALKHLPNH